MLDALLQNLDTMLSEVVGWLPDSPFVAYINAAPDGEIIKILKWVNVFVPIPAMIVMGELWLIAIAGYYIVSAILRWGKAVS